MLRTSATARQRASDNRDQALELMMRFRHRRHFTLLEMIAVLLIVVIVTMMAARSFRAGQDENLLTDTGEKLKSFLSNAGQQAITSGQTVKVTYDPVERMWCAGDKELEFPEKVDLRIDGKAPAAILTTFQFYPDGSAMPYTLEMSTDQGMLEVRCFPLSGRLEVIMPAPRGSEEVKIKPLWSKEAQS